ncbi:hypothetical protein PybrP1_006511 [[Pythium] brassicae (nom. inval.)]|nr:hypothetical protein PybrP1_006511 [[Pythium] brassicae (nom. inval.)]
MAVIETKIFVTTILSHSTSRYARRQAAPHSGSTVIPRLTMKDGLPLQLTPRKEPGY